MKNFFKLIDNLPIVRFLQALAIFLFCKSLCLFVFAYATIRIVTDEMSTLPFTVAQIPGFLATAFAMIEEMFLFPLILLALAEIIKLMKETLKP